MSLVNYHSTSINRTDNPVFLNPGTDLLVEGPTDPPSDGQILIYNKNQERVVWADLKDPNIYTVDQVISLKQWRNLQSVVHVLANGFRWFVVNNLNSRNNNNDYFYYPLDEPEANCIYEANKTSQPKMYKPINGQRIYVKSRHTFITFVEPMKGIVETQSEFPSKRETYTDFKTWSTVLIPATSVPSGWNLKYVAAPDTGKAIMETSSDPLSNSLLMYPMSSFGGYQYTMFLSHTAQRLYMNSCWDLSFTVSIDNLFYPNNVSTGNYVLIGLANLNVSNTFGTQYNSFRSPASQNGNYGLFLQIGTEGPNSAWGVRLVHRVNVPAVTAPIVETEQILNSVFGLDDAFCQMPMHRNPTRFTISGRTNEVDKLTSIEVFADVSSSTGSSVSPVTFGPVYNRRLKIATMVLQNQSGTTPDALNTYLMNNPFTPAILGCSDDNTTPTRVQLHAFDMRVTQYYGRVGPGQLATFNYLSGVGNP